MEEKYTVVAFFDFKTPLLTPIYFIITNKKSMLFLLKIAFIHKKKHTLICFYLINSVEYF